MAQWVTVLAMQKNEDLSLNHIKIKTHIGMANSVIPALRSRQADSLVLAGQPDELPAQ